MVKKDELNQVIETSWQELKKAWSMIKMVKGSEYIEAPASQAKKLKIILVSFLITIS